MNNLKILGISLIMGMIASCGDRCFLGDRTTHSVNPKLTREFYGLLYYQEWVYTSDAGQTDTLKAKGNFKITETESGCEKYEEGYRPMEWVVIDRYIQSSFNAVAKSDQLTHLTIPTPGLRTTLSIDGTNITGRNVKLMKLEKFDTPLQNFRDVVQFVPNYQQPDYQDPTFFYKDSVGIIGYYMQKDTFRLAHLK